MIQVLLDRLLVLFDTFISQKQGQKVHLLIDNFSIHIILDTIPKLDHVWMEFLPLTMTSIIQALDASIIVPVKNKFLCHPNDSDLKASSNIHFLDADMSMPQDWDKFPCKAIKNYFQLCCKEDNNVLSLVFDKDKIHNKILR